MLQRKKRVLFVIGLILVVGMLGTSLTSFFVSRASIRTQLTDNTLPLVGDTIYSEIQRDLLRPVFISSLMSSNTFVHDWVENGESDVGTMSRYLDKIQSDYGTSTVFFVSDKTKNYYHPTGLLHRLSVTDEKDAWYFRVRDMRTPFEVNVDLDAANLNELAVFVNYRVLGQEGEFLGAIGVGLSISSVTQLIASYNQTFNRVVYFVNKRGEIQLDDSPHGGLTALHQVKGLAEIVPGILASREQQALQYNSGAGEVFLNSRFIEELDWYLMVEQREQQVLAPITKTLLFNLAISLAIATVILALAHRVLFSYQKDLEDSAHLDKLTGAYNRHAFEALTIDAVEHSEKTSSAVSMMFIDIDHFKKINDLHGHLAGDQAIQHVVAVIKNNLRASDSVCRWGGEEFCVLLRHCTQEEGFEIAQAVRQAIAHGPFFFEKTEIAMTASIGVAQKKSSEKLSVCFQRMDDALYEAKNSGRNRVCVASGDVSSRGEVSACLHVTV